MTRRTSILIGIIAVAAVCALCAGALIIGGLTLGRLTIGDLSFGNLRANLSAPNVTASSDEIQEYNLELPITIQLTNAFGQIDIRAANTAGNTVRVSMHKSGYGENQASAEQALSRVQVKVDQSSNVLTLEVPNNINFGRNQGGGVDFSLEVPVQTTAVVNSQAGSISLVGTQGKADLHTEFGEVQVSDFKGGLAVQTAAGNITARRISLLDTGDGDVSLTSNFGQITLQDTQTGQLNLSNRSREVHLENVISDSQATLSSDFGEVIWRTGSAQQLTVDSRSGAVTLNSIQIAGDVSINTTFGAINLNDVQAQNYTMISSAGAINADGVRGHVRAQSDQAVQITGGEMAVLDLRSHTGTLTYRGSLGEGPHNLVTDFGDVVLSLPQDSAFNFDLKTNFGSITSDFEMSINGTTGAQHLVGTVNGGGPLVTAVTKNGSVHLEAIP